eukprot:15456941-Alexandrium_andersonii.AAC.1
MARAWLLGKWRNVLPIAKLRGARPAMNHCKSCFALWLLPHNSPLARMMYASLTLTLNDTQDTLNAMAACENRMFKNSAQPPTVDVTAA